MLTGHHRLESRLNSSCEDKHLVNCSPHGNAEKYISALRKNDQRAAKEYDRHIERLQKGIQLTPQMYKRHSIFKKNYYLRLFKGSGHRIYYFRDAEDYIVSHAVSKGENTGDQYKIQGKKSEDVRAIHFKNKGEKNQ